MTIRKSTPVYFSRLPVPKLEEGKFTYNYFEINEREEDVFASNFVFDKSVVGNSPFSREIKLSWTSNVPTNGASWSAPGLPQNNNVISNTVNFIIDNSLTNDDSIKDKVNESLNSNYTYLNLQDINLINSIEFKAKDSLQEYYNLNLITYRDPISKEILDAIIKNQHNFLSYIPNSSFDQLTSNTFATSVKNSDLKPLIANLEYNVHSQYSNTFKDLATESIHSNYQSAIAEKSNQRGVQKKLVGFYVDKYKVINGNFSFFKRIFVRADKTYYYDRQVTYDKAYAYTVKSIFKVTLSTLSPDLKTVDWYDYYLTSTPSNFVVVSCTEDISPPPPVDLSFTWVKESEKLSLMWRMPSNSQRDIKGFLIFKRKSIYESYTLLKMYDFNDANPRLNLPYELNKTGKVEYVRKNIDGQVIITPKFTFDDYDFQPGTSAIYAIACYDAHGLYSNLSSQISINLKPTESFVTKDLVSRIGAPISYPNLLIEEDLFLDSLVIDGYQNMKIYFDPGCDEIEKIENIFNNNKVEKMNVYETSTVGSTTGYQFTFLNIATQQFEKYELSLQIPQQTSTMVTPSPTRDY